MEGSPGVGHIDGEPDIGYIEGALDLEYNEGVPSNPLVTTARDPLSIYIIFFIIQGCSTGFIQELYKSAIQLLHTV